MLYVVFQLNSERYALAAQSIVEVLPLVNLKVIPKAPEGIVGALNYHGQPIPVLDLKLLAYGVRSTALMGTRIIISQLTIAEKGERLLGMVAERVCKTIHRSSHDFRPQSVETPEAPYLAEVTTDEEGIIQAIDIVKLIPANLLEILSKSMEQPTGKNS